MGAEDAQMVVEGMAQAGVEPTYCMGDDIPLSVLSDKPHMLYDYFKQRFAQVRVGWQLPTVWHLPAHVVVSREVVHHPDTAVAHYQLSLAVCRANDACLRDELASLCAYGPASPVAPACT